MIKKLIKLRDAAEMHREKYEVYHNSNDEWRRRKVICELDRFLMENRETAIILMTEALNEEVKHASAHKATKTRTSWWRKLQRRSVSN